jgi:hypothetical protein
MQESQGLQIDTDIYICLNFMGLKGTLYIEMCLASKNCYFLYKIYIFMECFNLAQVELSCSTGSLPGM